MGYPGGEEIRDCRQTLRPLVGEKNSLRFLKRFVENKDELQDLEEDYQDLNNFWLYTYFREIQILKALNHLKGKRYSLGLNA